MGGDNGKPGRIDWYDVWNCCLAIEALRGGTVQLNLSAATGSMRDALLLCASFVGEYEGSSIGAAASREVPFEPGAMLRLPQLAYELLESLDDAACSAQAEAVARKRRT